MEPPSIARYIPHKSKKRVFPGSSSSYMDPEVIEISPPINRPSNSKSLKQKEVVCYEIIDVDMDEDCGDIMLIDGKVDSNKKGKEALANISLGPSSAAKLGSMDGVQSSKKSVEPGSQSFINLDGSSSDLNNREDDYIDIYFDDFVYDDEYTILQSHFDNIDIPPGIEAAIPWFENKQATASHTPVNSQKQLDSASFPPKENSSHSVRLLDSAQGRKKSTAKSSPSLQTQSDSASHLHNCKKITSVFSSSTYLSRQTQMDAMNVPPGLKPFKAWRQRVTSHSKSKPAVSGGTMYQSSHDQLGGMKFSTGVEPFVSGSGPYLPHRTKKHVGNGGFYPSFHAPMGMVNPHGVAASMSNWKSSSTFMKKQPYLSDPAYSGFVDAYDDVIGFPEEDTYSSWDQDPAKSHKSATDVGSSTIPSVSSSSMEQVANDDVLNRFQLFKKFDTVQDHSDHHYKSNGSSLKQPPKNWAKKIQEEWKILEKDLPDTIFVRVYESRMDLLRAVIVGAEGTPYHDGLFFFDVFFPSSYPNVPPHVHYHSGGLRLNPNLYNCGKVCLSLLNTWSGGQKEKWIPGVSTMLQVLVSIQGLILNAKPYFNEPGFAHSSGSAIGEQSSLQYNESTFILSLKTMVYTMRRPPKYFEDFVAGHFCKHAHDILVACKAYIEGAQVGCLVKGGVQDVDEGDKSCSQYFKADLAANITTLVKAFAQIRAKDTEKFLSLAQNSPAQVPPLVGAFDHYQRW